jgi:hypothetical protein
LCLKWPWLSLSARAFNLFLRKNTWILNIPSLTLQFGRSVVLLLRKMTTTTENFSLFFKNEFKSVKWPTKGTVFDYFVENL